MSQSKMDLTRSGLDGSNWQLSIAQGQGSIINISSMFGLVAAAPIKQASYCASKGAIVNLTRELGVQWARKGVRVNSIAPGWFPSEMTADLLHDTASTRWVERN
jgi:NAD(P)-dependent dehydrogenase (short-subunit alcohol dehydrogenase family)